MNTQPYIRHLTLRFLVLMLLATLSGVVANGMDNYRFRVYRVEEGLSQNTIWCSLQDHYGYVWFGTIDGLNRFDGQRFRVFRSEPNNPKSLGNNFVRSLYEKNDGEMLVGTDNGLFRYNPLDETFECIVLPGTENDRHVTVNDIAVDRAGRIWVGTFGQGIYILNNDEWKNIRSTDTHSGLRSDNIWKIYLDSYGTMWVGTLGGGLCRFDNAANSFRRFDWETANFDDDVYEIFEDASHRFWIGTWAKGLVCMNRRDETFRSVVTHDVCEAIRCIHEIAPGVFMFGGNSGLFLYNSVTGDCSRVPLQSESGRLEVDDAIYSILHDREGGLWVGGYFAGLNYTPNQDANFNHYRLADKSGRYATSIAGMMVEDGRRNLWIATEDHGLAHFDHVNHDIRFINVPDLAHHNLHALMLDGEDRLWVGNIGASIDIVDIASHKVLKRLTHSDGLDVGPVYDIYRTRSGDIYVGGIFGLTKYNHSSSRFERVTKFPHTAFVYDILEDNSGTLWFGTNGQGVFTFNPQTGEWNCYQHNSGIPGSLASDKVISLSMDNSGTVWIGTEGGGLSRFNRGANDFTNFTEEKGLPNNMIYGIVPDRKGALWLSSNAGLGCFYPDNDSIDVFKYSDGKVGSQFNYKSYLRLADGSICFGGVDGINIFNPDYTGRNSYVPPVMVTSYECVHHDGSRDELAVCAGNNGKLDFYDVAAVSFEFAALSYVDPSKNMYAFRLKGVDNDWIYTDRPASALYRNLSAGKYTLEVRGSNGDGIWNPEISTLNFEIHPPVYRSNMAYFIYFILTASLAYWLYNALKHRKERRRMLARMKYENEKQHEYYETQLSFFTNIAHEIRTPLSLINAPLEDIKDMYPDNEDFTEAVEVMRDNTTRLMTLVNQLLDFRQLPHMSTLSFSAVDINALIEQIRARFGLLAKRKGIQISLDLPEEHLVAFTDREAIVKIMSNLMFNAIKYTRDSIVIKVELTDDCRKFVIRVIDNGKGVPDGMKEKIFTPFYTTAPVEHVPVNGSGLGLAIVSRLVELLKGGVEVTDNVGSGSVFSVELPVGDTSMVSSEQASEVIEEPGAEDISPAPEAADVIVGASPEKPTGALKTILIVEDNTELRDFLVKKLRSEYNVMSAENGKVALGVLEAQEIDMVITDVLMPEMDGMQLCEAIRANRKWNNICIIMLTAVTGESAHLQGLDLGADAYLSKPFSIGLLRTQIQNIFKSRARIRQEYLENSWLPYKESKEVKEDDSFVKEIDAIIEKHLTDNDFDIDVLASEMKMSRSGLHRKMRSELSMTPNDYVRLYRLKKAADFLASGKYQVSTVGYMVGFNTPSYFSKCFLAQFGVSPKDFLAKVAAKGGKIEPDVQKSE